MPLSWLRLVVPALLVGLLCRPGASQTTLTIVHTGDVRSNFLPVDATDAECPPTTYLRTPSACFGGASRRAAFVDNVRNSTTNPVLLFDGGNVFQGTLFFYQFRGKLGMDFMNMLNYTAANLGIREFDAGVQDLSAAIDTARFPVLSANLNLTLEPRLSGKVFPYQILNISGTTVAVIGWISDRLAAEGNPGPTVTVSTTAVRLRAVVELMRTRFNAGIIIGVSSNEGIAADAALIEQVPGIDIVIGAYGDTLLMTNYSTSLPFQGAYAGNYPYVVQLQDRPPVLIVATGRFGKFIGRLDVTFDAIGTAVSWTGNSFLLANSTLPNPATELFLQQKYNETQVFRRQVVGKTTVALDGNRATCRFQQCSLGVMVSEALRARAGTQIGFMNSGGIRGSLPSGNVTFGDIISAFPFQNTLARFSIRGSDLANVLTNSVSKAENASNSGTGRFLQFSGLRLTFNKNLPVAVRVTKVEVKNLLTGVWEPLQPQEVYTVAGCNFEANGGDDYNLYGLPDKTIGLSLFGPGIDSVVIDYIASSPDYSYLNEQFIVITNDTGNQIFVRSNTTVPEGLKAAFIVITGLCAIFPVFVMGYFYVHGAHAVVVTSSVQFVQLTLLASLLMLAGLASYILGFNDVGCMVFPWLSGIGFVTMYGSLFAKTWRIWQVLKEVQSIRRRMITNKLLFGIVAGFVAVEAAILVVWTAVPSARLRYQLVPDTNPQVLVNYEMCTSDTGLILFAVSLAYKGLLLLIGIYLSIVTRKVDSDFNEAKYIAISIYFVFFTALVVLVVLFIVGVSPIVRFVLTCIGVWAVTVSVYLLLYVPKIMEIRADPNNLWRGYFARRAVEMQQQFTTKSRVGAISGFGGSYISSFGDSSSDMQEAAKKMNKQQKKAYLEYVERNWAWLVSQKRRLEKFMDDVRAELKMPVKNWEEEALTVETPRNDSDAPSAGTRTTSTTPMESIHSVIVREDGSTVAGGPRQKPVARPQGAALKTNMYESEDSDTGAEDS